MGKATNELMPAQVAEIAGCSPSTVKRYDARGVIRSRRDLNGFRRYPLSEALKLREILATRTGVRPEAAENDSPSDK
jgi:DNA-binding transcriptional MerR regulator